MTEYDRTNSGVIFGPHNDQKLVGQGRLDVDGKEENIVLIKQPLKRDGEHHLVMYVRAGVLFPNDKKGNDKAPDRSGPLDQHPGHRVAAWTGEKDGRRYMSLKASRREQNGGDGGSQNGDTGDWGGNQGGGYDGGYGGGYDDDIPF